MRQCKPARGTARLTLTINGVHYALTPLSPHPSVARRAWRLRKRGGQAYDVALTEFGLECTCADFLWRREKLGELCKHCKALRALNLI